MATDFIELPQLGGQLPKTAKDKTFPETTKNCTRNQQQETEDDHHEDFRIQPQLSLAPWPNYIA
jgi:hypothetical protein